MHIGELNENISFFKVIMFKGLRWLKCCIHDHSPDHSPSSLNPRPDLHILGPQWAKTHPEPTLGWTHESGDSQLRSKVTVNQTWSSTSDPSHVLFYFLHSISHYFNWSCLFACFLSVSLHQNVSSLRTDWLTTPFSTITLGPNQVLNKYLWNE